MAISMSDVEEKDAGFELIPKGRYPMVVKKVEMKETGAKSKAPGTPMLLIVFGITEGDHKGAQFFHNMYPGEKFIGTLKKQLHTVCTAAEDCTEKQFQSWMKSCDTDGDWSNFLENLGKVFVKIADSKKLLGAELTVGIKIAKRKDTGEDSNQIVDVFPLEDYEEVVEGDGTDWDD